MASGTLSALAFIFISMAFISYVIYRSRVDNLSKREKAFDEYAHKKIFTDSRQSWKDGHIFGHLWKSSDIREVGNAMGYALDHYDILHIVGRIKEGFDKRRGINEEVISAAISAYVETRIIPTAIVKPDPNAQHGTYSFAGVLNAVRHYASTKG